MFRRMAGESILRRGDVPIRHQRQADETVERQRQDRTDAASAACMASGVGGFVLMLPDDMTGIMSFRRRRSLRGDGMRRRRTGNLYGGSETLNRDRHGQQPEQENFYAHRDGRLP